MCVFSVMCVLIVTWLVVDVLLVGVWLCVVVC